MLAQATQLLDVMQRNHAELSDAVTEAVRLDVPLGDIALRMCEIGVAEGLAPYLAAASPIVSVARFLRRRALGMPV